MTADRQTAVLGAVVATFRSLVPRQGGPRRDFRWRRSESDGREELAPLLALGAWRGAPDPAGVRGDQPVGRRIWAATREPGSHPMDRAGCACGARGPYARLATWWAGTERGGREKDAGLRAVKGRTSAQLV